MRLRLLAVALAAALWAPAAHAGGKSWTGFYIGGHVGAGWQDVDWANISLTTEPVGNDAGGFFAGGQLGYNKQMGSLVIGAEVSLSAAFIRDTYVSAVNPAAVTYKTDVDTITTVALRLGYASGDWLLYVKGGWAGAQLDIAGVQSAIPDSFSIGAWRSGWVAGGGFEYKLSKSVSIGVEYSYIDLGSENYAGTTQTGLPFTITDHDSQFHSVTTKLNIRF